MRPLRLTSLVIAVAVTVVIAAAPTAARPVPGFAEASLLDGARLPGGGVEMAVLHGSALVPSASFGASTRSRPRPSLSRSLVVVETSRS